MKTEITTSDNKSSSKPSLRELRNQFLIAWATYHGPRRKEIQTATWAPDNTGNFYKKNGFWYYQYKPVIFFNNKNIRKRIEYQLAYEAAEAIECLVTRLSTKITHFEPVRIFPRYPREIPKNFSPIAFRKIIAAGVFHAQLNQPMTPNELRRLYCLVDLRRTYMHNQ